VFILAIPVEAGESDVFKITVGLAQKYDTVIINAQHTTQTEDGKPVSKATLNYFVI